MTAQTLITRYNHFNGKQLNVSTLKAFRLDVQNYIDSTGNGPYVKELKGILERSSRALKLGHDVMVIDLEPIPFKKSVKKNIAVAPVEKIATESQIELLNKKFDDFKKQFNKKLVDSKANTETAIEEITKVVIPNMVKKESKVVNSPKSKRESKRPLPPAERKEGNKVSAEKTKLPVVLHEEKPADEKAGLPKSTKGLKGFEDFKNLEFKQLELNEKYKRDFLKLFLDTLIMIWGKPGEGKTVYTLEFAQFLASIGFKILYIAREEYGRSTLTEKIQKFNIGHPNLKCVRDLDHLKKEGGSLSDFDGFFFDSINALKWKLADFENFVKDNPGKLCVLIVQTTKEGDFRGGQEWLHEVDVAGEVLDRKLVLHKNRLDPDFRDKAEKIQFDSLVKEKKQKSIINEKVKKELAPETSHT